MNPLAAQVWSPELTLGAEEELKQAIAIRPPEERGNFVHRG